MIAALQIQIDQAARDYCGAVNTQDETLKECTRFVLDQYGYFSPTEIRVAFQAAAAGKLEGADLNSYNGVFSVRLLGSVLATYADYRAAIAREERARKDAEEIAASEPARQASLRSAHESIEQMLARLMESNHQYPSWRDLPYWFARRVMEKGLLSSGDISADAEEKSGYWIRAKAKAVEMLPAMILAARDEIERAPLQKAENQRSADPEAFPEILKPEAVRIYAKSYVFSKIAPYDQKAAQQIPEG